MISDRMLSSHVSSPLLRLDARAMCGGELMALGWRPEVASPLPVRGYDLTGSARSPLSSSDSKLLWSDACHDSLRD